MWRNPNTELWQEISTQGPDIKPNLSIKTTQGTKYCGGRIKEVVVIQRWSLRKRFHCVYRKKGDIYLAGLKPV